MLISEIKVLTGMNVAMVERYHLFVDMGFRLIYTMPPHVPPTSHWSVLTDVLNKTGSVW